MERIIGPKSRNVYTPPVFSAPEERWPRRNFVKMFDADKTRMIVLPYGEKNYDNTLSCFHTIPDRNGRTDEQTDRFAISISPVGMLIRDKKHYLFITRHSLV